MSEFKTREKDLETMAVLAAVSLLTYLVFRNAVFVLLSLGFLLVGLVFKRVAAGISSVWLRFSEVLGAFNAKIILSLVYFAFLTPIAVMFRFFNNNHSSGVGDKTKKSYFVVKEHLFTPADLEKMW